MENKFLFDGQGHQQWEFWPQPHQAADLLHESLLVQIDLLGVELSTNLIEEACKFCATWEPSKRVFQLSSSSLPGVPAPSPSQAADTEWCLWWTDQALSRLFTLVTGENLQIHFIVQGHLKGTTQRGCICFHLASFVGQIEHQIFDIWQYILEKLGGQISHIWLQMVAKLGGQPAKACLGQPRVVLISCRASPTCRRPNFAKSLKFSFYFQSRCSRVL